MLRKPFHSLFLSVWSSVLITRDWVQINASSIQGSWCVYVYIVWNSSTRHVLCNATPPTPPLPRIADYSHLLTSLFTPSSDYEDVSHFYVKP